MRLFETEEELKQACLLGPDDFKQLEYYYKLFEKGTVMYPPPGPAKPEEVRFDVIAHFHGVAVKMYLGEKKAAPYIRVSYGDKWDYVDIQTGKARHGDLPPEAQEMIDKWLPLHRDELLEMWNTQERKVLPPLE